MRRLPTVIDVVLHTIAATFALVVVLALITGGLRFAVGPFQVTATHPGRVALQGAVVWLVATLASTRRRSLFAFVPMVAVVLACWADSEPRRVGDGVEYMAMALNMSHGRPPALSRDDSVSRSQELRQTKGFEDSDPVPPLAGSDGRRDFHHFWLYPMLAAPFVAVARAAGVHPNHAFTLLNISILAPFLWLLARRGHTLAAGLIAAGPLMWWVDKAHAEVFLFVALAGAALLAEGRPILSLILAALATAQNLAAACMLAGVGAYAVYRERSARMALAIVAAVAIAMIPVAYYEWRLGVTSPLADSLRMSVPGIHAVLTPLLDPNLGLAPYAPVLVAVGAAGLWVRRSATVLVLGVIAALLLVFAAAGNVNHGGTPGMSRYALWLLAAMMPLVVLGCERLSRREGLALAALSVSAAISLTAFRPYWLERMAGPNDLAAMIWSRWPGLDNPLPEVFAERVTGVDGVPPIPSALPGCRKVLIRGDGATAWWPFPCEPGTPPPACARRNALCYVNAGAFSPAPAQPRFTFDPAASRAWSLSGRGTLRDLPRRLGANAQSMSLVDGPRRVAGGSALFPLFIVEGTSGTAIWARARPSSSAAIQVRAVRASSVELWQTSPFASLGAWRIGPGTQSIPLRGNQETLVLIAEED